MCLFFNFYLFIYYVKMGFLHGGQADLEFLTSGDPPTSDSQSARITGVSHRARPALKILSTHFILQAVVYQTI